MYDTTIEIGNSQLQHGFHNNRIYLMHVGKDDMPEILDTLDQIANTHGYTKIFAKVPIDLSVFFLENGYVVEAAVPQFFNGNKDCAFMGKYIHKDRSIPINKELNKNIIEAALLKKPLNSLEYSMEDQLPSEFSFKKAEPADGHKISKLYSEVFNSYPIPVFDPEYIRERMTEDVVYFVIWRGNEIVALSSCEMYIEDENVEMTDFAVLPEYRGYNFSRFLLVEMEKEMKKNKIKTAYTVARSCSYGMNSTFARCGYNFSGILVKNTQIAGKIEDMNVWYKSLE